MIRWVLRRKVATGIAFAVVGLAIVLGWFYADEEGDAADDLRRNRKAEDERDRRMFEQAQRRGLFGGSSLHCDAGRVGKKENLAHQ